MTESACKIITDLRDRYQGTPILTLAQTALWDDPVKALFKGILDTEYPGARLILGIMDTDYFSRLPKPPKSLKTFDVLPHNDTSTRELWSAVGEMHCLLGAETPLPLHTLASFGVRLNRTTVSSIPFDTFLEKLTEAWGWRGLAQTRGRRLLAGDVPLRECGDALMRQVDWALAETARVIDRPAGEYTDSLRTSIAEFVRSNPDASLTELYLNLLPGQYSTLLGYEPSGLEYTRSSELLRFNRWTANRARFRPLDLFLNPSTSATAKGFYNDAVRRAGIATLDRFGTDALPFDLAIPGHGRGTLHIARDHILVDTDEPIYIPLSRPLTDRRDLSVLLEENLGEGVALLGKAVVLITMLAHEYIFLFNETGSPYVTQSCRWNYLLGTQGLGMKLYPILRMGVSPWDTISAAGGNLALPPHMASVFGAEKISTVDFEKGWRSAGERAQGTLKAIEQARKPIEWLDYLADDPDNEWGAKSLEYRVLRDERRLHGLRIAQVNTESFAIVEYIRRLSADIDALEHEKGRHWRSEVMPLRDAVPVDEKALAQALERREEYLARIEDTRKALEEARSRLADAANRRRALKSDSDIKTREMMIQQLEGEAEREKASRVRNAWLTYQALEHSQPRPSAWWFPAVDPSGSWFSAMSQSAEFRWQSLGGEPCAELAGSSGKHEHSL